MYNQTPQNAKGSENAPLKVKKYTFKDREYKTTHHAWVIPTQHEVVDSNPGTPDEGAFIFKKR